MLWRAAAKVSSTLAATLPPGVDVHGYAALLALADDAARSQQWVADTVAVSRTTMTKVAHRLAADGLVERTRNPADRRSFALRRTPEGAAAAARWDRHAGELEGAVTAGLAATERRELQRLLLVAVGPELSPDTPEALRASTGFLTTRLHARVHADVAATLADLRLEPRHLGALRVLRHRGELLQTELAAHLGVSAATVVEIVDALEARGVLERRRSVEDRRAQLLHVLPRAATLVPEAQRRADAVVDAALAPLSPADRDRLLALLVRFVTATPR